MENNSLVIKAFLYIVISFTILNFISCANKSQDYYRKTKNTKLIIGEQYILPTKSEYIILDRDTLIGQTQNTKLIVYFSKHSCTSCSLKELKHWKRILKNISVLKKEGFLIDVLFILNGNKNDGAIRNTLISLDFNYPVMCDQIGEFEKFNLLPENSFMHCFILNKNNVVELVGNPLLGNNNWELFKNKLKIIANK